LSQGATRARLEVEIDYTCPIQYCRDRCRYFERGKHKPNNDPEILKGHKCNSKSKVLKSCPKRGGT